MDSTQTLLTVQESKKSNVCEEKKQIDLNLSCDSSSDISVNNSRFGSDLGADISPLKINVKTDKFKQMSTTFEEPRSASIDEAKTGDFPERKHTAIFGEAPLNNSAPKVLNKDVMLTTFAGKKAKLFFYTQRELLLLKDGTFCYKKKNKSNEIKLAFKSDKILKLLRSKKYIQISLES